MISSHLNLKSKAKPCTMRDFQEVMACRVEGGKCEFLPRTCTKCLHVSMSSSGDFHGLGQNSDFLAPVQKM